MHKLDKIQFYDHSAKTGHKKNTSEQINILWRKLCYDDKLSSNIKEVSTFLPKNCKTKKLTGRTLSKNEFDV